MKYENIEMVNELGRLVERRVLIINCEKCKVEVACMHFTNTCQCGVDYNTEGDMLADRSQWGYETGESAVEILNETY